MKQGNCSWLIYGEQFLFHVYTFLIVAAKECIVWVMTLLAVTNKSAS